MVFFDKTLYFRTAMKSKKLVCITLLFFLVGMLNLSPVIAATPPVPVNLAQISTEELDQSDEIKTVCSIGTDDPSYQGTPIYQNCSRSSPIVGTIPVGWNFHPAKSETADTADVGGWFPIVAISKEGVVTKISGCFPTDDVPPMGCTSPESSGNVRPKRRP